MSPTLIVFLCGAVTALVVFGISASRKIHIEHADIAHAEQAVRRSIWRHPRIRRFLTERFDRRSAGGFLLTASVTILFIVALIVGVLLDMIDEQAGLAAADKSVASWGSHNADTAAAHALERITQLGSTPVIAIALIIVAAIDYGRRRNREVFAFVAAIGIGEIVMNNLLKLLVRRERPSVLRLVSAHGYSFPSGHTVAATATWLAIALVLGRYTSRVTRALLLGCASLVAISVGVSRALLGVHWVTDVVAGLFIGAGWFMIVAIIFGGRAQRLGDPVSDHPQGVTAPAK